MSRPPFKPRALAPYIRARDTHATGTFGHNADVHVIQLNDLGRIVWAKDFDHEDVDTEFTADRTLTVIANILASLGVFALLMCAIAVTMQVPDGWLTWIILRVWGV